MDLAARREMLFHCDILSKKARAPPQQVVCHVSYSEEIPLGVQLIKSKVIPVIGREGP
jgi:hypothetical protein